MNDFLNGIFRIWEKLPTESKTAFSENLTVKEKSAVKIGKQLLEYYVDVSQDMKKKEEERRLQEEELLKEKKQSKKKKGQHTDNQGASNPQGGQGVNPLDSLLRNIPPEVVQSVVVGMAQAFQQNQNVASSNATSPNVAKPNTPTQTTKNAKDDDDCIDVEWKEYPTNNNQNKKK